MSDIFVETLLKQTAVYWEKLSVDRYGNPTYNEPVEIKCRWSDVVNELVDSKGTVVYSRARIMVDRDVTLGGVLLLDSLDSGMTADNVKDYDDASEIRVFQKVPDITSKKYVRTAYL